MTSLIHPPLPTTTETHTLWANLAGTSLGFAISQALPAVATPLLICTRDIQEAFQLEQALRFFAPETPLLSFPDWETLPYDTFSPHQDIISQRLKSLYQLPTLQQGILIIPIMTLMQRLPPREYIQATSLLVNRGDTFSLEGMRRQLEACGYRCVAQVMEHGEFAVRGSIFDLFPMGSPVPYRIDLLDEEVDTIREFDPETQRSTTSVEHIQLLPAKEFPLNEAGITLFRQHWRERFSGNPAQSPIYQDVSQGGSSPGIEYYLPLFFTQTATLFDYLPQQTLCLLTPDLTRPAQTFWNEVSERYEQHRYDQTRPLLPPSELYLQANEVFAQLNRFRQVRLTPDKGFSLETQPLPCVAIDNKAEQPLQALKAFLTETPNRVLFCAETNGRREALLSLLRRIEVFPSLYPSWQSFLTGDAACGIAIAPLEQGLCLNTPALTLITENQLFGPQVLQRRRRKRREHDPDAIIRNLTELSIGAPVVHLDHGVGRYLGLQTLELGDHAAEYLTLEYAGGDKLYVPVASLHLISRYSGAEVEHAPLHRLGTDQWQKAKRKAAEQIHDVAAELLDIQARRDARQGFAFAWQEDAYADFAASFPFEETADQQQAIEHVIQDMTSAKPMDRLVCGDVGFGKTEVAMRAAFIAVQGGKQVAILVPTTLLAQQHYQNFSDRFANWPVRIEVISRFRSRQEQAEVLQQLQAGTIDILIGTHKLLQEGIQFTHLGLVIIDEEHRFGVRQKERLKSLRTEVDILTLTATPIPRTLNMSLSGLRDLSIIATPPARRLSVKTFVRERSHALIREALMREILRGGQVYYLHNAVETIEKVAEELRQLVPEARISIGHGQMRERELEQVMADFYHHRSNVLVCTTIIETGIDIPSANTMVIERADKFGLAQLHQLRGRVGRSHHQAYAYLLTPPQKAQTADALKRLEAIASLEDLGAGFTLATHDLEIRGAGELLGEEQSGNMQAIGFSLYMELLERAVKALKSGKTPELELTHTNGTEIDLQLPALIPNDFIPDVHMRLTLYKRIANASTTAALEELQVEMIDRFGLLPEATKQLFTVTELKLRATPLGIRKIEANAKGGRIEFDAHPNIDPLSIIQLIQQQPQSYRLDGPERLRILWDAPERQQRLQGIAEFLTLLRPKND